MLRLVGPFITCLLALASTSAIAQAGATPPPASEDEAAQVPKAGNNLHPRQVLPVSFALRWSRRRQRMGYRSIFLSASYGRKVASMRVRSARRAPQASRNSCRRPPVGMALPTRSSLSRPFGIRPRTCVNSRPLWQSWTCCGRLQCRSRASQCLANEPPRPAVAEGVATRPSASTILLRTGTGRHRQC